MSTATITAQISSEHIPLLKELLKKLKAKSIEVKEEKDPTKMSKEDFFDMVDKSSKGKKYDMSFDELMQKTLSYGE